MAEARNELPAAPKTVHSFQESLTAGLEGGLRLSFDSFLLEADGKKPGAVNSLSAEGGSLAIHMDGLSLHSLGLDLSLPLGYNEVHRELNLTLVNDMVYFAIENLDDPSSYTFRYKADLTPYDSPIDDTSTDPLTGGIYQYEYGELDCIIDDIITVLTDGESLNMPSLSNDSSLDFQDILSSLEEVEETSRNGNPYFVWNLPLGENTLPLGFAGDGSYQLKGIDFPAKEENGSQGSYELKAGVRLSFSASFEALPEHYVFSAPLDEEAYCPLVNSTAIFEKIARYAKKKKFSLKAYRDASLTEEGLLLEHHEDAYVSETEKNYPAIDESLIAKVSANVDLEDGSFHSLGASLDLIGEASHQYLNFHILDNDGYTGYLDLNGVLKANTTKTVLDGLIANIEEFANDPEIANSNLNDLFGSFAGTGNILDNVLGSQAISQLSEEGTYSSLIASLTHLSGGDDILIEVNTAAFGLSGALTILLEGQLAHLAAITFTDFTFGGFAFTGTLIVNEYEEDDFDPSDYKTMSHLPGISEQMADLFHSKSASFSLEGYVLDADDTSGEPDETYKINGKAINQTGFTFSGSAMFNLVEKMGGGSLKIVDRKPEYTNDHHVSIFIEGPESEQEKEDMTEDWSANKTSAANNMLFSYDSKNDSTTNRDGKHPRTQPSGNPISGRFSIHSLNGILQVLGDLMSSPDERISSLFEGMLSTSGVSLLSKLQNRELAPIVSNGILVAAELGSAKDHFEISKDFLGTARNIILNLYYQNADSGLSAIEF
ncbi:MAG: hypothetical protein J6038_04830, partial [Bacilli bacterium]|nr:hypothetical protein [Bacilli bacterium]